MTYREAVEYLDSLGSRGWIFGLKGIRGILDKIGNPEKKLTAIHIAGTNGKGSTAIMISRILEEMGYKVGLYTSPHILSFRERIAVNGEKIKRDEISFYVKDIRASLNGHDAFTYFDFTTALAFRYFKDMEVDIAVIEVGLGGRFDSTNVINPCVSIITRISMDHTDVLGNTIEKIAYEKAGIIKDGKPVALLYQSREAMDVVSSVARARKSPLKTAGYRKGDMYTEGSLDNLSYHGINFSLRNIKLPLLGRYQMENLALSLGALDTIGIQVNDSIAKKALSNLKIPGRLEIVKESKFTFIFDVAHNPEGIRVLRENLERLKLKPSFAIVGVMRDKDWKGMILELSNAAENFLFIPLPLPRAEDPRRLHEWSTSKDIPSIAFDDAETAVKYALERGKVMLFTGSFYTVSEAKISLLKLCERYS